MARPTSCPTCSARIPREASYCPACGRPVGLLIDPVDLGPDEELSRAPVVVEPEASHGLRNLLIALAVVVVLVGAAITFGRGGSDEPSAVPTTLPPSSIGATTTRPIPPPSTTPFFEQTGTGRLLPEKSGVVLYGVTSDARFVRVDLDTGDVFARKLDLQDTPENYNMVATSAGAVIVDPRPDILAVPYGRGGSVINLLPDPSGLRNILPGPKPDLVWIVLQSDPINGSGQVMQASRIDGSRVGPTISLPALNILGSDGGGGLIGTGPGGTYVVDASGHLRRVTDEPPKGWNATTVVDIICDASFHCRWRVTDRATGQQRLLDVPPTASDIDVYEAYTGSVSPDGRYMARIIGVDVAVLDLRTGEERSYGDYFGGGGFNAPQAVWSADGHWLFWAGNTHVLAWRAGAAAPLAIDHPGVPLLRALAVGPR